MYCSQDAIVEVERRFKDRDLKIFWLRPYFSKFYPHFWPSALSNYIRFNQHFITFPSSRIEPEASRLSWWVFSTRNVDTKRQRPRPTSLENKTRTGNLGTESDNNWSWDWGSTAERCVCNSLWLAAAANDVCFLLFQTPLPRSNHLIFVQHSYSESFGTLAASFTYRNLNISTYQSEC